MFFKQMSKCYFMFQYEIILLLCSPFTQLFFPELRGEKKANNNFLRCPLKTYALN